MPSKRKEKAKADKRARKAHQMKNPGHESNYSRKRRWLDSSENSPGWGFDVPAPKPWKS